jgi:peptidoglycan-associated lipoprotein
MRKTSYFLLILFVTISVATVGCGRKNVGAAGSDMSADGSSDGSDQSGGDGSADGAGGDSGGADGSSASGAASSLNPVYFNFDQATLSSSARQTLADHYEVMKSLNGSKFIIEGHCDSRGTEEYNLALGDQRARAIRDYLVNLGLSSSALSIISYGEERPSVSGENESAWSQNRRGEFIAVDK